MRNHTTHRGARLEAGRHGVYLVGTAFLSPAAILASSPHQSNPGRVCELLQFAQRSRLVCQRRGERSRDVPDL